MKIILTALFSITAILSIAQMRLNYKVTTYNPISNADVDYYNSVKSISPLYQTVYIKSDSLAIYRDGGALGNTTILHFGEKEFMINHTYEKINEVIYSSDKKNFHNSKVMIPVDSFKTILGKECRLYKSTDEEIFSFYYFIPTFINDGKGLVSKKYGISFEHYVILDKIIVQTILVEIDDNINDEVFSLPENYLRHKFYPPHID